MRKPNTDRLFLSIPKKIKGYTIQPYSCECGCKKLYYHSVEIKPKSINK